MMIYITFSGKKATYKVGMCKAIRNLFMHPCWNGREAQVFVKYQVENYFRESITIIKQNELNWVRNWEKVVELIYKM